MGLFSGGTGWQTSDSYSGLRGTKLWKPHTTGLLGDYKFGMDTTKTLLGNRNPLGIGDNGLTASQNDAFKTLGQQLFSNVSSNYAGRGFLAPENVAGVIGSSLTQAAPTLMDQVHKNQMGNETIMADRFSNLLNLLNFGGQLTGQESHSRGVNSGPNALGAALAQWVNPNSYANMIAAATGAGGGSSSSSGAACWIAEALYGKLDIRTHLARFYVNIILPLTEEGRVFRAWYLEHGPKIASEIPNSPVLQSVLQPIFDSFVYRAALHLA